MKVPIISTLKLAIIFVVVVTFTSANQGCGDQNFVGIIHIANIVGSPVKLPCNVTSYNVVNWALIKEKTQNYIALGTNVFRKWQQHYSLNLSTTNRKDNRYSENLVYNLIVNEASEDLEGSYVCNEDGCNKSNVMLSVQVPPTLFLQVNGKNISNQIYAAVNEEINVTCYAIGGKPAPNLTWIMNGLPAGNTPYNFQPNRAENRTFDSVSHFQFRPQNESEIVTCLSTLEGVELQDDVNLTVFTYEIPTVSLSYDGQPITTRKYVALHQEINVTCEALNARPKADVTWINPKGSNVTTANSSISSAETLSSTVTMLTFSMTDKSINLECVISLKEANFTQTIQGTFHMYVPPTLFLQVNGKNISNQIYAAVNEEINVTCYATGGKPPANLTWIMNGIPVGNTPSNFQTYRAESRTFDSVSHFQFRPRNESEIVTCLSTLRGVELQDDVNLTVFTYEIPTVFLSYGGQPITTRQYVSLHQEINVTCEALNARPKANVTWLNTEGSTITTVNFSISSTGTLFSTVSMLTFSMTDEFINLDCVISLKEANITETIHAKFTTYVLPKLQLIVNGETVSNGSIFPINDVGYHLTCKALKARPTAVLSWTRNKIPFDDRTIPLEHLGNTNTNSTISTFVYKPVENETVSCISRLGELSYTEEVSVRFLSYDKSQDKIPLLLWLIPTASAIALMLLLCMVCVPYVYVKRLKAYLSTNIAENLDFTYSRDFPMTNLTRNDQTTTCKVTENSCSANATGFSAPPNLALPQIPFCKEEKLDYSEGPEDENNYYSTLHKKTPQGKMFYQKDMCMIYNMKLGRIYNRWMGTVNAPKESNKCVVMSTVTAEVLRTKEVHWDVYVKRVLELPKTNTLVKVEGIGVDKACLYIIHEHLTCETLFVRLNAHQNMEASNINFIPMFGSEVIAHMHGILEGMELLHSYGFVHPGLSTKKVLVTDQGNCKLYDFYLCEDACTVVQIKKSHTPRTGNYFAPEVILRNEYTKASDLWSTAVVLWELMSGSPPFAAEDQMIDGDATVAELQKQWPIKHQRLRDSRLLECWNQDPSLRPTIYHLRLSILQITDSLDTYTFPENSKRAESASYEPMHGSDDVDTRFYEDNVA